MTFMHSWLILWPGLVETSVNSQLDRTYS